jgi:putative MATE family efflux protein
LKKTLLREPRIAALSDLEGRSYLDQVWSIAWPSAISMLLFSMFDLVDLKWIGFLGTDAVAAASLVGNVIGVIYGIMNILITGTIAVVTRRMGAGDDSSLRRSYHQSVFMGLIFGLVLAAAGWVFAPQFLKLFRLSPEVYRLALPYLRIFSLSFLALLLEVPLFSVWIARGQTRLLLSSNAAVVVFNIILVPVLMFPKGKFLIGYFGWGIEGAAYASLVSEFLYLGMLLLFTRRRDFPLSKPILAGFRVSAAESLRVLKIGVPAAVAYLSRPLSTLVLLSFLSSFGASGMAGFGIGLRWIGLNFIVLQGLSAAISSLVGRYLGAGKPDRAAAAMRRAFALGVIVQIFISAAFYLFAGNLIAVMDPNPDTVAAGSSFLKWLALSMVLSMPGDISRAGLNGAGDTNPGMIASLLAHWLLKLALAWALAFPLRMGVDGVWLATAIAMAIEGLILLFWFSRGKWKTHQV